MFELEVLLQQIFQTIRNMQQAEVNQQLLWAIELVDARLKRLESALSAAGISLPAVNRPVRPPPAPLAPPAPPPVSPLPVRLA